MMRLFIWERYFLKEILKVFSLFLFSFFFLYAVMDYSTHMQDFIKDKRIEISHLLLYYTFHFLKRAPLLIPLALLISTIKVLTTLNTNHELVALQASGIKLKRLLRPFFLVGIVCCLFNFINMEFFFPSSMNYIDYFREAHFKHTYKEERKERISVLQLEDGSKLLYQYYEPSKKAFFDVLWLRSADDFWRIKYLAADPQKPQGEFAEHLQRNKEGLIEKKESYPTRLFSEIKWEPGQISIGLIPVENRSLSFLISQLKQNSRAYHPEEVITQISFKSLMPLLSLIVIMAAAPFCVRYSRGLPLFFIYLIALFGFLGFYALMNSAVILGENNTKDPFWVIFTPFALCAGAFGWKFARTK
jgi:lipopolysaccharide export system permease protein